MNLVSNSGDGILGEHTIMIDETGLRESTTVNNSHYQWSGVQDIRHTDGYIYIFTSSIQAFIIPKKAFRNQTDETDFLVMVQKYSKKIVA